MARSILITGGAGNIGGSLARRLAAAHDTFVVVLDDLSTGDRRKLPALGSANAKFIKGDVNDRATVTAVMCTHDFDYVFHYAAVVGVARTLSQPLKVLADIDGIRNILELSKNTGVRRVFFSSSSEVYGEPVEVPQREDTTPLNSRLPYAIVKNVGEAFFRAFYAEHGLPYTIFRFFNTYGPHQSEDFVIPRFLHRALRGEDITIYGDGQQTRTFCYIDDNLDATIAALEGNVFVNETVNIGNDAEITIQRLAETVLSIIGSPSRIVHLPPLPEGDMRRRSPDVTKMRRLIQRPLTTLDAGLQRLLAHHRESQSSKAGIPN